ncbi:MULTISPECIES: glycoside hydrolase domain-containing protein [Aeromonas]|nr:MULTISPECIES: glycoside hydrolase domain-containing protein [Aeromonas]
MRGWLRVYTIGRPLFDKVTMDIDGGKFTVIAENNGPQNIYVESVTINGKPLGENLTFNHSDILAGGELKFIMTAQKPTGSDNK